MKRSYLLLVALLLSVGAVAQSTTDATASVRQATAAVVDLYSMDDSQAEAVLIIQQRHFKNLAQIAPLRTTDYPLFLKKMRSIRQGTEASTRRLLSEEQLLIFEAQVQDRRKADSELIKQLKLEGKNPEEIQLALLERELEGKPGH